MYPELLLFLKLTNKIKASVLSPLAGKLKYWVNKIAMWIIVIGGLIILVLVAQLIVSSNDLLHIPHKIFNLAFPQILI